MPETAVEFSKIRAVPSMGGFSLVQEFWHRKCYFRVMAEVLTIGLLKDELLRAAARKREQGTRSGRPTAFERRSKSKPAEQGKENCSR